MMRVLSSIGAQAASLRNAELEQVAAATAKEVERTLERLFVLSRARAYVDPWSITLEHMLSRARCTRAYVVLKALEHPASLW